MEHWPNFFIVGAMKCGTTSLYEYLKIVPEIYMSEIKEPHYFSKNVNYDSIFLGEYPIREKEEYQIENKPVNDGDVIPRACCR